MIWRIFPFRREIKNAEQWTYHKYRPDIFQRGHLKMKLHICLLYNLCVDHLPHTDLHLSRPHYLFPSHSDTHSHKSGSTTVFFYFIFLFIYIRKDIYTQYISFIYQYIYKNIYIHTGKTDSHAILFAHSVFFYSIIWDIMERSSLIPLWDCTCNACTCSGLTSHSDIQYVFSMLHFITLKNMEKFI